MIGNGAVMMVGGLVVAGVVVALCLGSGGRATRWIWHARRGRAVRAR